MDFGLDIIGRAESVVIYRPGPSTLEEASMLPNEQTLFDRPVDRNPTHGTGAGNPNWRGGRSLSSNGYFLVRVGIFHHLSDVRGYAYEHRVNAEKKIGRRLFAGELVHHINGEKQDNRLENLMVVPSIAHHLAEHRAPDSRRQKPGELNPIVSCRCGCGRQFRKFDSCKRPREFVSGHNQSKGG
jgi:HNH endonuclease